MKCRVLHSILMESFQLERTVTGIRGSSTQRRQYRVHRVVQCKKLSALRTTALKLVMPAEDDPAPTSLQNIGELRCHANSAHPDIHTAIRIVASASSAPNTRRSTSAC
jgi:hypothetical protein